MVRKSTATNGRVAPPQEVMMPPGIVIHDDVGPEEDLPDVERIKALLGGLTDGESRVHVYRCAPGRKDVFLCELDPSEVRLGALQQAYGAGLYRVRVYGVNPTTGKGGLQVNQSFELGEPLARPGRTDDADDARSREIRELRELVLSMRAAPAPPPVDPTASMRNMLELLGLFKTLVPAPAPAAPAFDPLAMITMMREMKSFGEELAGNAPTPADESGIGALAAGLGGILSAMKQGQQAGQVPADMQQSMPPQMSPSPATMQDPHPEEDMSLVVRIAVGQLLQAARADKPVDQVADQMMQFASDELILGIVEPDHWFATVLQVAPDAAPHEAYFTRLRGELLSRYREDPPPAAASAT